MNPASDLTGQIRSGTAPRNLKEFAAKGLLPVPEEELITLQIFLSNDSDSVIAAASRQSLQKLSESTWSRMLDKRNPDPEVVNFCLGQKALPVTLKEKILLNHSIPDDVIVRMSFAETGHLLDLILNNHVRLLRDTRILSALDQNGSLTRDQRRRLEEFRTEFIIKPAKEKAAAEAAQPALEPDQDILQASVEDILSRIPNLDAEAQKMLREAEQEPQEEPTEEQVQQQLHAILGEEIDKVPEEILSTYQRILRMKQGDKLRIALLGNKEERTLLIRDTSRQVASMVLKSPKLTDTEIEGYAQLRNIDSDLLRQMGQSRQFIKRYSVIHSLVKNPKTPSPISLNLLKLLRAADLKNLERDKNLPEVIRRQAKKARESKEDKKEH